MEATVETLRGSRFLRAALPELPRPNALKRARADLQGTRPGDSGAYRQLWPNWPTVTWMSWMTIAPSGGSRFQRLGPFGAPRSYAGW